MDENATQPVVIDIQKSVQTTPASSGEASVNSVIEMGSLKDGNSDKKRKEEQKMPSLGGFELKVERKVEQHIVPRPDRRWDNHDRMSNSQPEYVDDLPPIDIDDEVPFFTEFSKTYILGRSNRSLSPSHSSLSSTTETI